MPVPGEPSAVDLAVMPGVHLRPVTESDAVGVYAAVDQSRADLSRWMGWCTPDYGPGQAAEFARAAADGWGHDGWSFVIVADDGTVLGSCGLNNVNHENRFCNLGYWVHSRWQGRGIATAATRVLARFGLARTSMQRLEVVVATTNHASLVVARRSGAVREGVLRSRLWIHDVAHDAVMHAFVA